MPASTPRRRTALANAPGVCAARAESSARPRRNTVATSEAVIGRPHVGAHSSAASRPAEPLALGADAFVTKGKAAVTRAFAPNRRELPPDRKATPSHANAISHGERTPSR